MTVRFLPLLLLASAALAQSIGAAGPPLPVERTGRDGAPMVLVPAGEFMMGDAHGRADERPAHRVFVSAFYLDKYEVTNERFARFLNEWGKDGNERGRKMIEEHEWGLTKTGGRWVPQFGYADYPVVAVTWFGAARYAKWAGKRLPTEAEWEGACRAGGTGTWCFGDDKRLLRDYAWVSGDSASRTHPVGTRLPNAFGLFDMHGNVWEWCADWYGPGYYRTSPPRDPSGPSTGSTRVMRGGSWDCCAPTWCGSATRRGDDPAYGLSSRGFRCAASPGPVIKSVPRERGSSAY
jgi:formylglycine-generating enzyme required for sulfatase activity